MGYYQGDFYQGDPGFFSMLTGIASKAAGFIPGVGPVASAALGRASTALTKVGGRSMIRMGASSVARKGMGIVVKHPVLSGAAAAGALTGAGAIAGRVMGRRGMVPAGAGMRRHRRMRVTNPKALRRAIRRTQGFAKLAMRTIHLVHPKKRARFGGFKKRTRKAA